MLYFYGQNFLRETNGAGKKTTNYTNISWDGDYIGTPYRWVCSFARGCWAMASHKTCQKPVNHVGPKKNGNRPRRIFFSTSPNMIYMNRLRGQNLKKVLILRFLSIGNQQGSCGLKLKGSIK